MKNYLVLYVLTALVTFESSAQEHRISLKLASAKHLGPLDDNAINVEFNYEYNLFNNFYLGTGIGIFTLNTFPKSFEDNVNRPKGVSEETELFLRSMGLSVLGLEYIDFDNYYIPIYAKYTLLSKWGFTISPLIGIAFQSNSQTTFFVNRIEFDNNRNLLDFSGGFDINKSINVGYILGGEISKAIPKGWFVSFEAKLQAYWLGEFEPRRLTEEFYTIGLTNRKKTVEQ